MIRSVLTLGVGIDERKRIGNHLLESEGKVRYLASQFLHAQERERKRISRDLHDDLGQSLMVLKLQLKAIGRNLPPDLPEVKNDLDAGVNTIDAIVENLRRLANDLRPPLLEELGLPAALRSLMDNFRWYDGIKFSFKMSDIEDLFSPERQLMIYRIFQEALTNIAKYAHATKVSINIRRLKQEVVFFIKDNGKGFDVGRVLANNSTKRGLGLSAMEERINILGGLPGNSEPGRPGYQDIINRSY